MRSKRASSGRKARVEVSHEDIFRDARRECLAAGVTEGYLDRLTTAFVADGALGFNRYHTKVLFGAGVDPEYANAYLGVGSHVTLEDVVELYEAGVSADLGVTGLGRGLSVAAIISLHEQGIPAEYVDVMYPAS